MFEVCLHYCKSGTLDPEPQRGCPMSDAQFPACINQAAASLERTTSSTGPQHDTNFMLQCMTAAVSTQSDTFTYFFLGCKRMHLFYDLDYMQTIREVSRHACFHLY